MEVILRNMARNRRFFILEIMTGMGQFTLITGAFLAGFIHLLGGSDGLNGTMGAIPSVMGFMQIASALYMERLQDRKKAIVKLVVPLRIVLGLTYIVPVILLPLGIGLEAFILMYMAGFALNALVAPAISDWLVNSTPMGMRGRYFAKRERFAFVLTIVLSYGAGKLLDYYKIIDLEAYGFVIVGGTVLILGLINILAMSKMTEINHDYQPSKYSLKEAITMPFSSPAFRKVIMLFLLWGIGLQMGGPFIAVYMISKLQLSYTYVMAMTIAGTIVRVFAAPVWGKIADDRSWFLSAEGALLILALTHMSWAFVTGTNYAYLIPVLSVTSGIAWGGIGLSLFNLQFMFAEKKGRTLYIALNAAISGSVSLAAVRFSGTIIDRMGDALVQVAGMDFTAIQLVVFISSWIILMMPLYIRLVLRKQKQVV